MCLTTRNSIPIIAKKDITCYKIYNKTGEGCLSSPYLGHIPSIQNFTKLESTPIMMGFGKYIIKKGFHSFKHLKDAKHEIKWYPFIYKNNIIYKCIIPKGSKYYRGISAGSITYCSESLILKEICV